MSFIIHDITHCKGETCPEKKRQRCYRYIAYRDIVDNKIRGNISLFIESPYDNESKACKNFMDIKMKR